MHVQRFASALLISILAFAPAYSQTAQEGRLSVIGRGTVRVTPEIATVRVAVTTKASSAGFALDTNSKAVRALVDLAINQGVAREDVGTTSVQLAQAFREVELSRGTVRQVPDGYNTSNSVVVRFKDFEKIGSYLRGAVDSGANRLEGVFFGVLDSSSFTTEAGSLAVQDAVTKAREFARVAGIPLGRVERLNYKAEFGGSSSSSNDGRLPTRRASPVNVPIEAGTIAFNSEVELVWLIAPSEVGARPQ